MTHTRHIFLIILCALAYASGAWAQEGVTYKTVKETYTTEISGAELQNLAGNGHTEGNVTFKIDGGSYSSTYKYINIGNAGKSKETRKITLTPQTNYSLVSITSATVRACAYRTSGLYEGYMTVMGGSRTDVGDSSINPQRADNNYTNVNSTSGLSNPITIEYYSRDGSRDFYINKVTITYVLSHKEYLFNFSATACTNIAAAGTASALVASAQVQAAVGVTSASTTATFTATANAAYEFDGWGTTATATTYESTANPYSGATISNSTAGSTANKTLYAIFKPVFNFTATANRINGSYGTATAVVTAAKVIGATPDATSASTTATFKATPKYGCTFEGWYYDEKHTQLVSSDAECTSTITNSEIGSTANLTLYAWFKSNQTLTWSNDHVRNIVNGTTVTGAAKATASSGLTPVYESSAPTVATVDEYGNVTGVSVSATPVTITVSQAGNDEFNAATPFTREFTVITKYQASFEVRGFTGTAPTIRVGDTPTIALTNVASDFESSSSDEAVVGIARSGDVITLTALKVGTAVVTLNQPENATHSAVSATYTIKVAKVENSLGVTLSAQTAQVDATIDVAFSGRNNTETPIEATITEQTLTSDVNSGTDVITYADGVITACNAGTAKITFTQAETDKYEGFTSSTYDVTVTKHTNTITLTLAGGSSTNIKLKYGETAALAYSSEHSGTPIVVSRVSGTYTTYSAGTITAGSTQGTDTYEITQAETYKYEAGYATFMVRVNNTDEKVGYVLYENAKHDWSTISSWTTPDINGPTETLIFDAYRNGINYFYISYQTSDGTWVNDWKEPNITTGDYATYTYTLPVEDVTHIKFGTHTGATLHKYMNNIFVTRKTYVRASSDKTALGTLYTGQTASATVTVNYSSTNGGNINVSTNNPHFVPSVSYLPVESGKTATGHNNKEYLCGVDGTQSFTVTYTPDPNQLGEESAVITIGDLFYTQQITLTATATKRENTLSVIGAQNLNVDDEVEAVYASKNSEAALGYSISREGVISFDPTANKITAIGAGTATLTLTQPENDYYFSATKTVEVNVSKIDQTLAWDNDISGTDLILNVGDHLTTNTATASSGLAVTYFSSIVSALEVDAETGELIAKGGGSNIAITATQAGNYKYNEASITRYFTVIQKNDVAVTTSLSESETNRLVIGSDDITIQCNATVTEDALTISGDKNALSVTFANNTFTLHALAVGSVTLTLTRAADDAFNALSKTYSIEVVKPTLILSPTDVPAIDYSEYGTVTLQRTLPTGFSTIALPFDTDVKTLTSRTNAEDWVAQLTTVTYNAADGYTLYFDKVIDGEIQANEPYVLHLGTAVMNPTWTDIEIAGVEATTITANNGYGISAGGAGTYADWTMSSNFEAGKTMNGLYGIVNSGTNNEGGQGGLRRGGIDATLNAFSAYITSPAQVANAPRLRVAYIDRDGTTTMVESLPTDDSATDGQSPTAIYGPDGQRRPRLQRGLNIVRQPDGTSRKVFY